jgi:hypothetical protein
MPDEPNVTPPTPETPPETPPADAPPAETPPETPPEQKTLLTPSGNPSHVFFKEDGTFVDNWEQLLPEEIRTGNEETLKLYRDLPNLAKAMLHHKSVVGKNKIPLPDKKSSPEEWNEFYRAVGRPETPGDYKVEAPEDLQEIYNDEALKSAKEAAHAAGITQPQFEAMLKWDMDRTVKFLEAEEKAEQEAVKQAEEALRREFGAAYDQRIHVANRLVAETLPVQEQQMAFLEKFGNDPDFVRFASKVGSKLVESNALVAEMTTDTPGEIQGKIDKLMATPGYMDYASDMDPKEKERITNEIMELRRQQQPTPRTRVV